MSTLTVEALDVLVHTVIYTLWTVFLTAFIVGAVLLHRHNAGLHRDLAEAADTGHQPAHARPARPSRLRALADSVLDNVGELAAAHALLTSAAATHPTVLIGGSR